MFRSVRIIDFRCFESLIIDLDAPTVFLTGDNAQGKTSLLEAMAVVSRLGSPKATVQSQFIRYGCNGSGFAISTQDHLFKAIYQEKKFAVTIDGYPVKRKEYLMRTPKVVWMDNRDIDLIKSSGEKRRRYLNAIGAQHSFEFCKALKSYNKALQSRNALLKANRSKDRTFQAFTQLLVSHGQVIINYRQQLVEYLKPFVQAAHESISQGSETLDMIYTPSTIHLAQDLSHHLTQDILFRQTCLGPHRDDIKLLINNKPATTYASEGQQRTLALTLRLAQGALLKKFAPNAVISYLIDDIFGELDKRRKNSFMECLPNDAQKVLTTTDLDWCDSSHQVFLIKDKAATLVSS